MFNTYKIYHFPKNQHSFHTLSNGYESISLDCPFGHFVLILNKVWSRWIPNQVGSSTFFFGLIVGEIMIGVS